MAVDTSAGSSISISSALPATEDQAGYEALSFTLIGEVESIAEYGTTYNPVTFTALDNRRVRKFKGSYDNGDPTIAVGLDKDDAGQQLAVTARDTDEDVSFRVTYQDGSIDYFTGKVMSFTRNIGGVENITMANMGLGINSDLVEVDAP